MDAPAGTDAAPGAEPFALLRKLFAQERDGQLAAFLERHPQLRTFAGSPSNDQWRLVFRWSDGDAHASQRTLARS